MSLLANAGPYGLTKTWYVDGTATDVEAVTIGVTDANGDTVVAAGTSTTDNNDGTYTYQLSDVTEPNLLTATWIRSDTSAELVDRFEVMGARLFTEAQARAFDSSAMSNATTFPDADIADGRDQITFMLEQATGRGWVPRYCRAELPGSGTRTLQLRKGWMRTSDGYTLHRPGALNDIQTIISASVGGTAVSTSNIVVAGNELHLTSGVWTNPTTSDPLNVTVEWVYGMPYPVDGVDRIALLMLRDRLVSSSIPDRALSWSDDIGTVRLENPGRYGNISRIPEVNDWVKRHNIQAELA